jgi:hypothetical protein
LITCKRHFSGAAPILLIQQSLLSLHHFNLLALIVVDTIAKVI